jgi:hypothetical protein
MGDMELLRTLSAKGDGQGNCEDWPERCVLDAIMLKTLGKRAHGFGKRGPQNGYGIEWTDKGVLNS